MDTQSLQKKHKNANIAQTVVIITAIVIIAAILSVMLMMIFDTKNDKQFTASYLASEVVKKMNYENMSEISKDNIQMYYDIPDQLVSDKAMFVSARPENFTELACFKLKDEKDEPLLLEIVNAYLLEKVNSLNTVSDQSDPAVNKSSVYCKYPYVFVVIANDSDNAVTAFSALLDTVSKDQSKADSKNSQEKN